MTDRYADIIRRNAVEVIDEMAQRESRMDVDRLRLAFEFAAAAHAPQRRKNGEPYILHPIAVARICAHDMHLGVDPVIAAFLHDVVEDTPHTIDEVRQLFGDDVAFLVRVVTKQKKERYEMTKQLDNFKQMLNSVQYDIRAILIKLADRLHNMRTLASMPPDKQMKIAGETDYFYAPLATRLGLYDIKTELENLSFRFRCPHDFAELERLIDIDSENDAPKINAFCERIRSILGHHGISVSVDAEYRQPYSLWRKMNKYGDDYYHLKYRHIINVVFDDTPDFSDKRMVLRIYAILTDTFEEKPNSIINYIDSPKENGYRSFHVKLLSDYGRWEEVHISSRAMITASRLGCVAESTDVNLRRWIEKFKGVLREIASDAREDSASFIEKVVTTFYNDDITVYTPKGHPVKLPQRASALDFAYEIHSEVGNHAHYARINGQLMPVSTMLHRGDVVEIFTSDEVLPQPSWLNCVMTFKARHNIGVILSSRPHPRYNRCDCCKPIPGEEVIGFKVNDGSVTVHKRNCPTVIRLASQLGDNIVSVDYAPDETLYPVTIAVRAVDRRRLLIDVIDCITNTLQLPIGQLNTSGDESIVECRISFNVHSFDELHTIINHIAGIDGVDLVSEVL